MQAETINLMEVCGTHTMSIAKSGIKRMLPENVKLLSGPGCPVCVTPAAGIDAILELSERPGIIIATYGDMLKVPGSRRGTSLAVSRAKGADVRVVFSPMDSLDIAERNPGKGVVFLGVGFETTAPGTAATIGAAAERGLENFSVFTMLKTVEPALRALISDPEFNVQGFICPGHVATIIGEDGFRFLTEEFRIPACIAGFEPEDILKAIGLLVSDARLEDKSGLFVRNQYRRAVEPHGNALARAITEKYLEPSDEIWRGLGAIPGSGLGIRKEYEKFDAAKRFGIVMKDLGDPAGCRCGDVICGKLPPEQCPLFGKVCVPEDAVGPCMVSSEGACAAAYKYQEY